MTLKTPTPDWSTGASRLLHQRLEGAERGGRWCPSTMSSHFVPTSPHPPYFQPWKWQLPFLYLTINKEQGSSEPWHVKMLGQKAENRVKWVRGTNFLSRWQFYPLLKRKRQEWNMPNVTTKPLKRPRKIGCLTSGLQIKVEQSRTCCRLVPLSLLTMTKMFIIHQPQSKLLLCMSKDDPKSGGTLWWSP